MERTTLHALTLLAACLIVCLYAACRPPCDADGEDLIQSVASVDADARRLETVPDMAHLPDQSTAPDMAPRCIFDRDCGSANLRCCAGRCVALDDRANCGACGTSCGADPGIACCRSGSASTSPYACMDLRRGPRCGSCGVWCPSGGDQTCCDGVCSRPATDDENCGMCGVACRAGQRCWNGRCEAE